MFKRLLALALIATPALASAQTVNASASVAATATLTTAGAINFGAITPGTVKKVLPNAGATAQVTFNTTTATITVPASVTLTNTTYATATMDANLTCNTDNSTTEGACGASVFNYNGNNTTMASGTVYIGGVLPGANSTGARVGTYSGTITVTVANSGV